MFLNQGQINQFRTTGVLIAKNVLKDSDLQPVIDELNGFIDHKANQLLKEKKITSTYSNLDFPYRIAKIYGESREIVKDMDIMEFRGKAMHQFLSNSNLLDAIESLIGPEITCSPIQHVRAKMPNNAAKDIKGLQGVVPWHQDAGVTSEEAEASEIVTCWIPLLDATKEMGCMELIPNSWQKGYLEHVVHPDYGTTIRPDLLPLEDKICAECPKGGVVFMNKMTPHRGLVNESDKVRWNIDLRYQKTGTPTGRSFYPDFPVRSKKDILQMAKSHELWANSWIECLEKGKGKAFHPRAKPNKVSEQLATVKN